MASTTSTTTAWFQRLRSRKPGTMCTPSMMVRWPSVMARSTTALTPTAMLLACSMKPASSASLQSGSGMRTPAAASNDEYWISGMRSGAKKARMTWRTVSVETTREMPRRWAIWVASVLLPTPVVPPTRMTSGRASRVRFCHLRKRAMVALPSSSPSTALAISSRPCRVIVPCRLSCRRSPTAEAIW